MDESDAIFRQAAFAALDQLLVSQDALTWSELHEGFTVPGSSDRIHFATRAKGIFKPRQMQRVLSIKTVTPRVGRKFWYADQNDVHAAIFGGDGEISYSFRGEDPNAEDNRLLRQAFEERLPLIYFVGISPAVYRPFYPVFLTDWSAQKLNIRLAFALAPSGFSEAAHFPLDDIERRYALRLAKQRLHQVKFREAVIDAYDGRCVITRLPERRLLDAAHIVADSDETFGQPVIRNGLSLSKIHHAALDANLIGIDPDGIVWVSERLREMHDGPFLQVGMKDISGLRITPPQREEDRPDRDRLARRFELFKRSI
jgi:putative restriction endonuclease